MTEFQKDSLIKRINEYNEIIKNASYLFSGAINKLKRSMEDSFKKLPIEKKAQGMKVMTDNLSILNKIVAALNIEMPDFSMEHPYVSQLVSRITTFEEMEEEDGREDSAV